MLHVHRAERADGLVEALRALLADPLPDPFAPEVVAVPTRGMERWLTQRISDRLGICANVEFPFPRTLVADAIATASGVDPAADPWLPERMVWPLLDVVDASLDEPWAALLAAHLSGSDERRARRFATVRHLAELFDRYALHRPALVEAWAAGAAQDDWQAELWRRLRDRIGTPGPAERLAGACERLRGAAALLALPPRLALFGLTRLPAGHLDVLAAIAAGRDVHLFLLHPSPALWDRVAAAGGEPVRRRADDPTKTLPANRLLASWGHDVRELQLVIAGAGEHADHHHPVPHEGGTLLARIQAGVREDRMPEGVAAPGAGDRSVEVHACHGRARQVEVLRDAILHLLADDPTLEPRDVIVMCPDIEAFAPLIHATFGAGEVAEDDDELPAELRPPDLRVRLADRSLRQTNPILGFVGRLLDLAGERLTASQLLDLADREPVRRRFHLDDRDVVRIEDWIATSGIRWGLDAAHRAPFKLDALAAGTWQAGLDRLLVGVTMSEDEQRLYEGVLPLDDVDSGAIDLAGRFAELVDRVGTALDALRSPQPIGDWAAALGAAADALTATSQGDAWQRAQLQRILDDVVEQAAGHAGDLALAEVRGLLAERLQGRPTRSNFRTGHLTICTLVPMRSVPHRVVCLLGLDDGVFPRKSPRDGDDRLLDDPHVGERDARTEDRQLLLDALMAATERLIVTYTGNDERTNVARPPAVPVGELLDMVDRVAGDHRPFVVGHPLHPFDTRNFERGAILPGRPWSFDGVTLDGARALDGERADAGPFLPGPLPERADPVVEVADLVAFVKHPVGAFLRRRLRLGLRDYGEEPEDALTVEIDPLRESRAGQRVLDARLAGVEPRAALLAEIARGTLPPGVLGLPVVERVAPVVEEIVALAGTDPETSVDVHVALADGRTLSGTIPGVTGDVLRTVSYSRVTARHRLTAWVRLLALSVAYPERPFEAITVGRAPRDADEPVMRKRIPPLGADAARAELAVLIDLFDRGMREPPPLACLTSAAYANAGANAEAAARDAWESGYAFDQEDRDPEHQLVFGGVRTFAELLAEPPRDDEPWNDGEASRFGRWARRLWDGLLEREE